MNTKWSFRLYDVSTDESKYYVFFWEQVAKVSCSSDFSLFLGVEERSLHSVNHPRSNLPDGKKVHFPIQFLLIYMRG